MNNDIKQYLTKGGKKRFRFTIYLGKDALTGRSAMIRRKGFKSLQEAQEAYLEYQLKITKGEYNPNEEKHIRFKDAFNLWKKSYQTTVKESTYATTMRYFDDHILNHLGDASLDKLSVYECQKVVNVWFDECPRIFKRFIRYTNNVINYAINLGLVKSNPMEKVIRPKAKFEPKEFTDFYSKEELNLFLEDAKKWNYQYFIYFRILGYSGMRKGEALALKWTDINFMKSTIQVDKTVTQGIDNRLYISDSPKTKNGVRTLDMDRRTMNYLKQWRLIQQKKMLKLGYNFLSDNNLVFPTINNGITEPSKPTQWNNSICKHYHLRHIKVHGFRHTHASLLFEAGAKMEDVKERLGHASIQTTMNIYTHVTKSRKEETAKRFAEYMES